VPWYDASVAQDGINTKVAHGEPLSDVEEYMRSVVSDGFFALAATDADVSRAWTRSFNLLTPPYAMLTDQSIMPRVLDAWAHRAEREPPPPMGPDRETFLRQVHA